jgi:uncharacterized repeat protein (TIGR01451 family)
MKFITGSRTSGRKIMLAELLLLIAMAPSLANAEPQILLDMVAYRTEIVIVDGQEVTKQVETTTIEPGQELEYKINFVNEGDEPATSVIVNNPIASETLYVPNSATGEAIEFSADGGSTFHVDGEVIYQAKVFGGGTEQRTANADRYTNIRWVIGQIEPGQSGELTFKVKVK